MFTGESEGAGSASRFKQRLADMYMLEGNLGEAERLYDQTLKFWQDVLGPDHPAIAARLDGALSVERFSHHVDVGKRA